MTLAWSMDKIGPIARTVEDCALVFAAIHGFDGLDPTAVDRPFEWPPGAIFARCESAISRSSKPAAERDELRVLTDLGVKLVPIKLPSKLPVGR